MDGYVIGMTAHSSPIEGQHLKQQNTSLFERKARIHGGGGGKSNYCK